MKNKMNLQNNFTTPEQSKRLLELGVPEWTADCCFSKSKDSDFICEGVRHIIPDDFCVQSVPFPAYPCWSVGRLIEIYEICFGGYFNSRYFGHTLMEDVLLKIEEQIDSIDFSKLDE